MTISIYPLPAGWSDWSDLQRLLWLRQQPPGPHRDKLLRKYEMLIAKRPTL